MQEGIKNPNKNIKSFGKPLIAWTIEAALKSKNLDRIIVTTEHKKLHLFLKIMELRYLS